MNERHLHRLALLLSSCVLLVGIGWIAQQFVQGRGKHRDDQMAAPVPLSVAEVERAAALYGQTCGGCHGERMEGVVGPSLIGVGSRYSLAKIERIAQQGKGRKKQIPMPSDLVSPDDANLLARWLVLAPKGISSSPFQEKSG